MERIVIEGIARPLYKGHGRMLGRALRERYWRREDQRDPAGAVLRNAPGGMRDLTRREWGRTAWGWPWRDGVDRFYPNEVFSRGLPGRSIEVLAQRTEFYSKRMLEIVNAQRHTIETAVYRDAHGWLTDAQGNRLPPGARRVYRYSNDLRARFTLETLDLEDMNDLHEVASKVVDKEEQRELEYIKIIQKSEVLKKLYRKHLKCLRESRDPNYKHYLEYANTALGRFVGEFFDNDPVGGRSNLF